MDKNSLSRRSIDISSSLSSKMIFPLSISTAFWQIASTSCNICGAGAWWWRREARAWRAGLSGYATLTQPEVQVPGVGDRPRSAEGPVDAPSAGAAGEPWVGPVPGGRSLVPQWFVPTGTTVKPKVYVACGI